MRNSCLFGLVLVGCSVSVEATGPTEVAFTSPSPGAMFTRDELGASGALVAGVDIDVDATGDFDRVAITVGDQTVGEVDGNGALAAQFGAVGPQMLTATAYLGDTAVASSTVAITIADPQVADCKGWLDLYQLQYTVGPVKQGVDDPVTVTVPINGVSYRYSANDTPRETLYGDCTLMKSLAEAAPIMRAHDITELVDIGVYNYRCIGGGTPPDCPNGISQHAYAKAIDIAGFTTTDGTFSSVLTDWVIDADDNTCTTATEPGKDAFLHQVICELKSAEVWNIVLTPNYNDAHRNHFHVDLTPGSDFIERLVSSQPLAIDRHSLAD